MIRCFHCSRNNFLFCGYQCDTRLYEEIWDHILAVDIVVITVVTFYVLEQNHSIVVIFILT